MRTSRSATAALAMLAGLLFSLFLAVAPAGAQASPCPPGQPIGRPPGTPPNQPGQPTGRPPAYPPGRCNLALSQSAAQRGQSVQASGQGFVAGETVEFFVGSQRVASAVADPSGNVSGSITVPNDAPIGRTEVRAESATQVLSAAFEVLAAAAPSRGRAAAAESGGSLARTGAYIAGFILAGASLVALGTIFVVGARRRRDLPAT